MTSAVCRARVVASHYLTPTVRWFQFQTLDSTPCKFSAGQWLDLRIPGTDVIGGYSMCSSPLQLANAGRFDLAVKLSDHPAASWMHEKCAVGMELSYSFGGDVYLDDADVANREKPYLLVAGGVGINPIYSILQTALTLSSRPTRLLYSVQTRTELMFANELNELTKRHENLKVKYFITKEADGKEASTVFGNRMKVDDMKLALEEMELGVVCSYICGPDNMITSISDWLLQLGLSHQQIHYERWT